MGDAMLFRHKLSYLTTNGTRTGISKETDYACVGYQHMRGFTVLSSLLLMKVLSMAGKISEEGNLWKKV